MIYNLKNENKDGKIEKIENINENDYNPKTHYENTFER